MKTPKKLKPKKTERQKELESIEFEDSDLIEDSEEWENEF